MSVFRIEKTSNYTVMANYHFKEKEMSLKAKGLLSLMLSLPDDWDYTISGLVSICKENETAIKSALEELKLFGYLQVIKNLPTVENSGRINYNYIVYEKPIQEGKKQEVEILPVEILPVENQGQLNTNILNTNNKINNNSIINNTIMEKTEKPKTPFNKLETNIEEKPKKEITDRQKKAIERNKILEEFIKDEDEDIKKALKDYVDIRKKRGLEPKQLQIILEDFEKVYSKRPKAIVLEQIRKATARGWSALVFEDTFKGTPKVSYSSQPSIDNTKDHNIKIHRITDEEFNELTYDEKINCLQEFDAVADMTPLQKEFFNENCLARDENGNLQKF